MDQKLTGQIKEVFARWDKPSMYSTCRSAEPLLDRSGTRFLHIISDLMNAGNFTQFGDIGIFYESKLSVRQCSLLNM